MDKIILVEDLSINENNLEERVYQMTLGGQREPDFEDIKSIPFQHRIRAIKLMDIYRENPGIKLKREEESKVLLEDRQGLWDSMSDDEKEELGERWDDLSKRERELVLRNSVKLEEKLITERKNRKDKFLSEEVKTLADLSLKDWSDLPKTGRNLILKKLDLLEQEINKIPEIENWEEISEEKREAILKAL